MIEKKIDTYSPEDQMKILAILKELDSRTGFSRAERSIISKEIFETNPICPMKSKVATEIINKLVDENILHNAIDEELDEIKYTWKKYRIIDEGIKYEFSLSETGRFFRQEGLKKVNDQNQLSETINVEDRIAKMQNENFVLKIKDQRKFDYCLKKLNKIFQENNKEAKRKLHKNELVESIDFVFETNFSAKPKIMIINKEFDLPLKPGYGDSWIKLFEFSRGKDIPFDDKAKNCVDYFNSNNGNKLYAEYGYIKNPIMCRKDSLLNARIPIKLMTEKEYEKLLKSKK